MTVSTTKKRTHQDAEQDVGGGPVRFVLQSVHFVLIVWVVLSAIGPTLQFDSIWWGMLFTYPPRLILAIAGGLLLLGYALYAHVWRFLLMLSCVALLVNDAGWVASRPPAVDHQYTLLAFNVQQRADQADRLAKMSEQLGADLLCLQEVGVDQHEAFRRAAPPIPLVFGTTNRQLSSAPATDLSHH